ncbi:MAG: nickel-dependent hydrogenase large subunit [Candidatus Pacebacteria bacterium]|nr:nickel-dependent hydrogenase large subunit [Candidatus Paceibacterota bacterium]
MEKLKIAFFDLTGCEGCEFHLLSLNEHLLDLFQDFEITHWRLLSQNEESDFDVALIEGAVTTREHIRLLKKIRQTSKIVVAIGACAISGNVFAQIPENQRPKLASKIYNRNYQLKAKFLEPVKKFIKVDKTIPGCPPDLTKFKKFIQSLKKEKITSKIQSVKPPDYVAKIEGHGQLKVNFVQKKAVFRVEESERLIEGLLLGKNFQAAPFINARICGICPVAHNLCSWKAIENALDLEISLETRLLREIYLAAQMIKSHLLHLFFLVLPDFAKVKSSIELSQKYPAEFHLMLNIKRVSEKVLHLVGGSNTFPTNTTLAGFIKPPERDEFFKLRPEIDDVVDEAHDLINLFAKLPFPKFESQLQFLTTQPFSGDYPLYQSRVPPEIKEMISHDSTAKIGLLPNGKIVKVGALARLTHYADLLNPKAGKALTEKPFSYTNPYHNNLAQTIEILHFLETIQKTTDLLLKGNLEKARGLSLFKPHKKVEGQACLEAPRGILIHQIRLSPKGKIEDYNIIPPTQINLASLEAEAQQFISQAISRNQSKLKQDLEKLIRAFDPCITCAVH